MIPEPKVSGLKKRFSTLIFEDLFSTKLSSESACRAHKGSTEPGVVLKYAQSTETWDTLISCQSLYPNGEKGAADRVVYWILQNWDPMK